MYLSLSRTSFSEASFVKSLRNGRYANGMGYRWFFPLPQDPHISAQQVITMQNKVLSKQDTAAAIPMSTPTWLLEESSTDKSKVQPAAMGIVAKVGIPTTRQQ